MSADAKTSVPNSGTRDATTTARLQVERSVFSSTITSDRLRESARWASTPSITKAKTFGCGSGVGGVGGVGGGGSSVRAGRRSVFKEVGLEDYEIANITGLSARRSSMPSSAPGSGGDPKASGRTTEDVGQKSWYSKLVKPSRPMITSTSSAPPATLSTFPRLAIIAFLIAIVLPGMRFHGSGGRMNYVPADGVGAGAVLRGEMVEIVDRAMSLEERDDSPTNVCTRWSHQSAILNGTVYIYGGQAKNQSGQTSNTWNNDFLTLDLTKGWEISSPSVSPLPQPSGPPAVANGYLWNSMTSLFLYGGLFSDEPPTSPSLYSTWEYSFASSSWIEHQSPTTTTGNNSDPGNAPVQRSAEGAGLSVPELGLSWYFGGHQDMYTTAGWSDQIARIYLRSLLEFTHPGFMNTGVQGLGEGQKGASSDGAYRNITQGGVQNDAGFTERADGVLVYVPGWGKQGILLGLAGGTNETFTEMNVIDVYDIASTTWYKQATSGTSPPIRVDPCAVVFAAPDASSFNVYLYGGQNLLPYDNQTQYSDLWILSIPSFTWIQANLNGQSQPPARAGHTCHAWDGQMVVVGGYVGTQISCDSPGIYVFNASSLQWRNSFASLSGTESQSEQIAQDPQAGLPGSYGYQVPAQVQSVIGGNSGGSATATTPASGPATDGPIATGSPPTFTITRSGSTVIETAHSTSTSPPVSSSSTPSSSPASSSPNTGVIIAAVIAGVFALLAAYLAFCTWLYRRQLSVYKNHVAMSQRTALGYSASPENRMRTEKLSGGGAGVGGLTTLGAFGTEIASGHSHSGTNSAGRSSLGGNSGPGVIGPAAALRNDSSSTGQRIQVVDESTPALTPMQTQMHSGLASTEYQGAAGVAGGLGSGSGWGVMSDHASVNSSTEDLLAGHEPSFISVVMSPRRTLRVINRD